MSRGYYFYTPTSLLDLNDDVLVMICQDLSTSPFQDFPSTSLSLKAFSATCRRVRSLADPILFHHVKFSKGFEELPNALRTLNRRRNNSCIRRLTIKIPVFDFDLDLEWSAQVACRLAHFIRSLERLETLTVDVLWRVYPEVSTPFFEEVGFLPRVTTLQVASDTGLLITRCPSVVALVGSVIPNYQISYLQTTPQLFRIDVRSKWDLQSLAFLSHALPNLQELGVVAIGRGCELLQELRHLRHLRVLAIDARDWENDSHELPREVVELQAPLVFQACRWLEVLWVGELFVVTVNRAEQRIFVKDCVDESWGGRDFVRLS